MYRAWNFLTNCFLLLIMGALIAPAWANTSPDSHHHFVEFVTWDHAPIGHLHDGHRTLTLHYLVNAVLMAFFFAIATKKVWEAIILKWRVRTPPGCARTCTSSPMPPPTPAGMGS